jgi:hypothetical protein
MHDWMFEAGGEPLSLTLAEQPGSPDPGAADWFSHEPADDFETWLFETQPKADLEDFGPMFVEGEGGGDDDGAHELDEVVVTGSRIVRFPTAVQVTIGDVEQPVGGDVGGGGVFDPVDEDDDDCGPPPDGPTPAGVDVDDIRDKAREVARDIAARNDAWEWGAIIYVLNGQLFSTGVVTQMQEDSIGFNYSNPGYIPNGAHIVAWVHSHPATSGTISQDYMSDRDAGAGRTMRDNANGRFTVDSALMTYLIDNELDRLLEFDGNDREGSRGKNVTPCGGLS